MYGLGFWYFGIAGIETSAVMGKSYNPVIIMG